MGQIEHPHTHIVWSRIDLERMATISDSHNYRKHELVARELERQFGHERVQGAHIERDGQPRPERTPSHEEMQQAGRGHVSPKEAKALLTELWQQTDSGQAFRAAAAEQDWMLAHGDRHDFVAIDPYGGTHSLARRIEGARAADIRERMADLNPAQLPSVEEARQQQQARQAALTAALEASPAARPAAEPERAQEAAPEPPGTVADREEGKGAPVDRRHEEPPEEAARDTILADIVRVDVQVGAAVEGSLFVAAEMTGQATEKLTDFVAGLTESLGGTPPQRSSAAELARDPAARRDYYQQQVAERASNQALERMGDDLQTGRTLKPDDVRSLTHAHLLQIKAHGDDYLRQVIDDHQRAQERQGRERERDR